MLLHTCVTCQNDLLKLSLNLRETIVLHFYKKNGTKLELKKLNHFDT